MPPRRRIRAARRKGEILTFGVFKFVLGLELRSWTVALAASTLARQSDAETRRLGW